MIERQAKLTGMYRGAGRERHRHQLSVHALCTYTYTFNHTCTGRQAHEKGAPHLPRYQNSASPDKLACARACQVLTSHLSVTFLSELHVVSHRDKESPKEPTCHPSSPLSLPIPLFPAFLCWVLSNEAGIGSRSQHHMLHNSQAPVVIAEAFIKDSATTSMVRLRMNRGLMVSN